MHRVHHQNTDKEGDPHSPRDGGLWAHMGWIITGKAMHRSSGELLPFVPDLRKDKFHVWISRWHWVPLTVLGVALFVIGGWSCLLWGLFLRTVVNLHGTWLVNSATHMWGSQRFLTGDASTNSFWVAMLTLEERDGATTIMLRRSRPVTALPGTNVRFQGNRMTLRTPPFLKGGVKLANQELVCERMKPETPGLLDRN